MKSQLFQIVAALAISTTSIAADPTWLAAIAPNSVGGVIELGAIQRAPCKGDWYNAGSNYPAIGKILRGCWRFNDKGGITVNWEDHTANDYGLFDFHWSDWVTAKGDAQPQSTPQPKIEHKPGDTIL